MDERDHLLSSLEDHLEAAAEKSDQTEVQTAIKEAKTATAEVKDADAGRGSFETLLDSLDAVNTDQIENPEVTEHIDAAQRAAKRARDR
ncbi:hypothetical protein [Halovenus salina]|nr:hypothetical protein [Halovenus salina]